MSIRPIDMQVNIMKEGEQAKSAEKDKLQQDGVARFAPQTQKEEDEKKETVQNYDNALFNTIDEKGGKKHGGQSQKQSKKSEDEKKRDVIDVKDPARGNIIDIKS